MTSLIDLTDLKAGDEITLRDGTTHVVSEATLLVSTKSLYIITKTTRGYSEGTCSNDWAHYLNGRLLPDADMPGDIVSWVSVSPAAKDVVNSPSHYQQGGIQTIDVIEAWGLGFSLGNAVKYLSRAGKKDSTKLIEDLRKSIWYIEREIKNLEKKDANL